MSQDSVTIGGVTLKLGAPMDNQAEWIGQREVLKQLLACWLVVDDQESALRFFLDSKTVVLDEVTVSEERLEELDMVDIGYVSMEKKKVGFAVYDIPEERISEMETTVTDVLQEVPGLIISSYNTSDPRTSGLSNASIEKTNCMKQHKTIHMYLKKTC